MAVGDPVRIVAPTITRFTMKHTTGGGRRADCVVDVSIDEFSMSRDEGVNYVADHICAPWQDNILSQVAGNITFLGCHFVDLDSLSGETGDRGPTAGHPTTGAIVGTPFISPQVSYLVHKSAGSHRGTRNGRMYVPGLAESEVDEAGIVQASRVTSFNTKLESFRSALATIGGPLITSTAWRVVHVHKGDPEDPATWTWSSSTITSAFLDVKVATQRRRLRG